jgi:glycosyltransferase involved in cell wall biosynthesis
MRVLLSAYACEPNKGSEQEVGWQRALHMRAFADEVWVLTRANNQSVIEADPMGNAPGLHFIYYDLPHWALKLKKRRAWFLHIYYALWQWGAYRVAAKCHRDTHFDCVYHVTFASMKFGSYMGRLGIPFVIGPVAGGERSPWRLRRGMLFQGKLGELFRGIGILLQRFSPLTRPAYAAATRIYVATPDSLRLVPSKWRAKTSVQLAIGTSGGAIPNTGRQGPNLAHFVFAGRLLHWKGVHLAIRALVEARRTFPAATLTVVGEGPAEAWLRVLAKESGVASAVEFAGHVSRQQLVDSLPSYTALVFPSLHDSGGLVVLEAFAKGLPAICLDLGGPGCIVNESCGVLVSTAHADEAQTVTGIANAMVSLGAMTTDELQCLSKGAVDRANELTWATLTKRIAECEGLK